MPITGFAFYMSHRNNQDVLRLNREDDRIREILKKTAPEGGMENAIAKRILTNALNR